MTTEAIKTNTENGGYIRERPFKKYQVVTGMPNVIKDQPRIKQDCSSRRFRGK